MMKSRELDLNFCLLKTFIIGALQPASGLHFLSLKIMTAAKAAPLVNDTAIEVWFGMK